MQTVRKKSTTWQELVCDLGAPSSMLPAEGAEKNLVTCESDRIEISFTLHASKTCYTHLTDLSHLEGGEA